MRYRAYIPRAASLGEKGMNHAIGFYDKAEAVASKIAPAFSFVIVYDLTYQTLAAARERSVKWV